MLMPCSRITKVTNRYLKLNIGVVGCCRPKKSLHELVPGVSDDALHLLTHLLHFNPDKRLTADQALRHLFVKR